MIKTVHKVKVFSVAELVPDHDGIANGDPDFTVYAFYDGWG